jgi:hypothetical protein
MPKYLIQASYVGDAFYYAFGETDVVAVIELPDNSTAAGVVLLIAASGKINIKTTARPSSSPERTTTKRDAKRPPSAGTTQGPSPQWIRTVHPEDPMDLDPAGALRLQGGS